MSAREPPLFRRFVNAAWPGVSMKSIPGISSGILNFSRMALVFSWINEAFIFVKEIF